MQIARLSDEGGVELVAGNPECREDPCELHGTCHCMCVCGMDVGSDCAACLELFGDDQPAR